MARQPGALHHVPDAPRDADDCVLIGDGVYIEEDHDPVDPRDAKFARPGYGDGMHLHDTVCDSCQQFSVLSRLHSLEANLQAHRHFYDTLSQVCDPAIFLYCIYLLPFFFCCFLPHV